MKAATTFHAVEYNEKKQAKGLAENVYFQNFGYLQDKSSAIKAASAFYGVDYNEDKQQNGQAEKIHHQNFPGKPENEIITKGELKKYLEDYSARNCRIKNPQFHAILSCKGNEHSFAELKDHALELMNRLGYSGNPMLIYEHKDTKNNHIHIVTTRVRADGKKINHNLEGKRANRILNDILKLDSKQDLKEVLEKCLSYNISTVPQFNLLMEQRGYNVNEKDDNISFFKHGTGQGSISKKAIEEQISKRIIDARRTRQIKAFIHKYKLTHDPAIVKDKNPNIHTAVKPAYHSELTNYLHTTLGIQFIFHGEKNKDPYGYTIIDHKEKSVYKGSEVIKLEELRRPAIQDNTKQSTVDVLQSKDQAENYQHKQGIISAEKNSEEYKRPEETQVNNETKEAEKSIINTNYSIGDSISDTMREVDKEANSQSSKKKRKPYTRKL